MAVSDYPCPCCGYLVFDEPPGSYAICPICFWEDDAGQLAHPDSGGANAVSLRIWFTRRWRRISKRPAGIRSTAHRRPRVAGTPTGHPPCGRCITGWVELPRLWYGVSGRGALKFLMRAVFGLLINRL